MEKKGDCEDDENEWDDEGVDALGVGSSAEPGVSWTDPESSRGGAIRMRQLARQRTGSQSVNGVGDRGAGGVVELAESGRGAMRGRRRGARGGRRGQHDSR